MATINAEYIARKLGGERSGDWWRCPCPVHRSSGNTLALRDGDNGIAIKCHAGCTSEAVRDALMRMALWPIAKCDLKSYAAKLNLTVEFLVEQGLADSKSYGSSIRIPYVDDSGTEVAVRFRRQISGGDKFRWQKGAKPVLYGLNKVAGFRSGGEVAIVEGESDCLTLWFEGFPAVGLPGASTWDEARDARHFDGFETIHVVIEPDSGGSAVLNWLRDSSIRNRARLLRMPPDAKDPAALYQRSPAEFAGKWEALLKNAEPWDKFASESKAEECAAAKARAKRLLDHDDILGEVVRKCHELGIIGESDLVKLTYLIVTARVFDRLVSLIVKGPSASGKSFTVRTTLRLFPESAYIARSSLSERALIYSSEVLAHRMLVLYEAAGLGLKEGFLAYIVRSLLSEGEISYETTEKVGGRIVGRQIQRPGPTGLILTTCELAIDAETETRCLSVPATDTPEQTAAIMRRQAAMANRRIDEPDLSEWHAFQTYLGHMSTAVVIPYAETLAALIRPAAVRLRRDHPTMLTLIKAHALLHQGRRQRDGHGAVVATVSDYETVRDLVHTLIGDTAGVSVPEVIRQTREAVRELLSDESACDGKLKVPAEFVTVAQIAKRLGLDNSTAWRRVKKAMERGFLTHHDERHPKPLRIKLGDPIDGDADLLPTAKTLRRAVRAAREAAQ